MNQHLPHENGGQNKCRFSKQNIWSTAAGRLRNREIFGVCNMSRRSRHDNFKKKVFTRLPKRLAMPLTSLVDDVTLHDEAHIFLGFSSCDRFLISYTERIEEASHTGFLSHIYTLHWWLFNPGMKASKIGSVRLFSNEEIEYSLYLCYAEWPNLKSQVIVYGWRKFSESCYISIVAVPPTEPCKLCNFRCTNSNSEIEEQTDVMSHNRCTEHGFAMHFKQASGASQLGVLNTSGLKIDGIMILNIGHSIAVISTGIVSEDLDVELLPLSSIKRAACEDSITDNELTEVVDNVILTEDTFTNSEPGRFESKEKQCKLQNELKIYARPERSVPPDKLLSAKSALSVPHENSSPSANRLIKTSVYDIDSDDSDSFERISLHIAKVENKENIAKRTCCRSVTTQCQQLEFEMSLSSDPYFDPEPKSIVLGKKSRITDTKSSRTDVKRLADGCCGSSLEKQPTKPNYSKCSCKPYLNNQAKVTSHFNNCDCDCAKYSEYGDSAKYSLSFSSSMHVSDLDNCVNSSASPAIKTSKTTFLSPSTKSTILGISNINKSQNNLELPRSELNFVTPSPTPSECSSSIHCSTDSNHFQSSNKNIDGGKNSDGLVSFSECLYGSIPLENIDDPLSASENNLFYCSMFCQGSGGEVLHPVKKGLGLVQAFSQHLVLDLEHVIFDILRTRCYMTYKFGYLVDYEANVMDVCSDTKSVVIHIVALLNVAKHRNKTISEIVSSTENVGSTLQQAEFILCWSLHTGRYEVVVARPIKPYNEKEHGDWKGDWIVKMDSNIKQQCAIRTNTYRSVYILDNSAVFRQHSLNVLWNCDKTIAVTK
ncbi:uncharacterized protein LOC120336105 [Styela clava]